MMSSFKYNVLSQAKFSESVLLWFDGECYFTSPILHHIFKYQMKNTVKCK